MELMAAPLAAEKWNISAHMVASLCSGGHIAGAQYRDKLWFIPANAELPVDLPSLDLGQGKPSALKPFVKWAGGKGQLLPVIRQAYPGGLGKTLRRYAEPFVGGGAVLFDVLGTYNLEAVYISDVNAELINAYQVIRNNVGALVDMLSAWQHDYWLLDGAGRKVFYYQQRERFNQIKAGIASGCHLESAALFIFLNHTCFNGLYRVNRKNLFNVPIGSYSKPAICDPENLHRISRALDNVTMVCGDYQQSAQFIDKRTFVYFDPPYRPLSQTSSFTAYTDDRFGDQAQMDLAAYVQQLDKLGASVLVSNSDPKNGSPEDDFFDVLYSRQNVRRIAATRIINSKATARGKISELLIGNY